ncbi:MFS transporter [Spirillospora sp. NPDC047279]|uniref:MFS transporter n=1 Tax=Spirillospora sp. NPDC047279 TaxID=3155478 RepID=UPI0033FC9530
MRSYRELYRTPEFTPLFVTVSTQIAAVTVTGLALATLVFAATGSPLLSALSMFGPSIAQVLGATLFLSAADRLPPRAAITGLALVGCVSTAALALPGLPVGALFAIVLVQGLVGSVGGGVRYGLLSEILPEDGYLLGRSVLNMSSGITQVCGFAAGGLLVTFLSPRGTLLAGAGLYLLAAASARLGLARRPPRAAGRPSIAQTWRTNARLWSSVQRRTVYVANWVPNGLVVGCEALFVPYAPHRAGVLLSVAAAGMLLGDVVVGRFVPFALRLRLAPVLRLLLPAPYLMFAAHPPLALALVAVGLASVGFSASLLLQERLMALTPDDMHGQALGLDNSGMLTMQAAGAALAGAVAQQTSPATAITVMAALSATVTLALAPGLRPTPPRPPTNP